MAGGPLSNSSLRFFATASLGKLTPPASHSSSRSAPHRVEVLGTLRALAAHLLLALQLGLRLVHGLPAVATVARPTAAIPVVPINRSVFAGEDVVLADCHAGVGVGVVSKSAPAGRALTGVDVTDVTGSAASDDTCIWVVSGAATISVSVSCVDIRVVAAASDGTSASLSVVIGASRRCTVIAGVRICPGRACP